jgi:hypothetical protein
LFEYAYVDFIDLLGLYAGLSTIFVKGQISALLNKLEQSQRKQGVQSGSSLHLLWYKKKESISVWQKVHPLI